MFKYPFTKHVSNVLEMFNESDKRWFLLLGDIKKPVCIKAQQQNHYSRVSKTYNISIKVKIRLIKKNCKVAYDLSSMKLCNHDILLSSRNKSNLFTLHR